MQASAAAIAHIVRLRTNGFTLNFADESNKDLGILAIADKGNQVIFIYPNGDIDEVTPYIEEDDGESYADDVRAEYIYAIGA